MSEHPEAVGQEALRQRADPRTNTLVKWVLRIGLLVALVLLVVGFVVQLAGRHHEAFGVRMFDLLSPHSTGERIMALGILALTLTPACGVVTVVLSWVRERDMLYVGVGLTVVAVLTAAVVVGFVGG